jgi:short-subunit dehydrogenase
MSSPAAPRFTVVTGASAGIGLALTKNLARGGRPVLAVARRSEKLRALAEEARASGWAEVVALPADLADPGAADAVLARAEELGGAEWLVNNAGFGAYGAVADAAPARLAALVRVNCEAVVLLTRAFLPSLVARGGFVLNVASVAAFLPMPFHSVYAASKAFVLSFTEGLAEELRGTPAGAGAFCPGPVDSEFVEVAGLARRPTRRRAVLSAEEAAAEALAQLRAREVVRVPRAAMRLAVGAPRLLPRAAVRRLSALVNRPPEAAGARRPDGRAP